MSRRPIAAKTQLLTNGYVPSPGPERAVLVGVGQPGRQRDASDRSFFSAEESLDELALLSATAKLDVAGRVVQTLRDGVHPATFIGAGKANQVKTLAEERGANVVIVDEDLSPAQQRNLENVIGLKVIDRSQLILDIFAQRARSLAGKLQVELAQLEYLRPRLTRQWTHLSRLGGGVGTRGPGETQLEVDRRSIRERIATLRRRLRDVERTRALQRHERARVPFPCVALVGYTNAGKSTLMNTLTQAGVVVEDKLFATLDPTSRRLTLPGGQPVMLIDTVGFINKLPHQLVDAFKSTLEEVRTADLLVHVVDATHARWSEQQAIVERVLTEIGAGDKPTVVALNKLDRVSQTTLTNGQPQPWHAAAESEEGSTAQTEFRISALTGAGLTPLLTAIEGHLQRGREVVHVDLPLSEGTVLAWLRRSGNVIEEAYSESAISVTAVVSPKVAGQLRKRLL